MAWRVRRRNDNKNQTVTAPSTYPNGEAAFRAAMDNVTKYITDHWDAGAANDVDGPSNNHIFKIYIKRRPGEAEIELRYDYNVGGSDWETNSIYWRVVNI